MLRKLFAEWIVIAVTLVCLGGCGKTSDAPAPPPEPPQTQTESDYKAEADKEITAENMDAELEAMEKAIEAEAKADQ